MKKRIAIIIALVLAIIATICGIVAVIKNDSKQEDKIEEKKETPKKDDSTKEEKKEEKENSESKPEEKKEEDDGVLRVPDLTGLTIEEATAKLNSLKIKSHYSLKKVDSDKKKDTIVKTEPEAGKAIEGELEIVFYLSKGVRNYEIGEYTGKNYLEVKAQLEDVGIVVEVRRKAYNGSLGESQVIDQSVKAGTKVGAGDSIILYIPEGEVKYPDFTSGGYTKKDVEDFCKEYGIKLEVLYGEPDGTQIPGGKMPKEGEVFSMDKTTNDIVKSGDTLTIQIAKY